MSPVLAPFSRFFAAQVVRRQQSTSLWSPAHWGAVTAANGSLEIDGVDAPNLVEEHGSPLMAVSNNKLHADASRFLNAIEAAIPNSTAAYSYKTNCVPGVLKELHKAGFAAEVISPYELWLAENLAVPGDRIIVNGVNKSHDFIDHAVRLDVRSINIDQPGEVGIIAQAAQSRFSRARVSLRLRLNPSSHFGLDIASGEADDVAKQIAKRPDEFDFQGLHFHLLADNDDPKVHIRYQAKALDFARRIEEKYGLTTTLLNVGSGFTVPTMKVMSRAEYGLQRLLQVPCGPPNPDSGMPVENYIQQLADALKSYCTRREMPLPHVVFEPGRAVTSQSHVLLTKVHAIKANSLGPEIAMTDAGKILTSYPCDYEYHQMFVANRMTMTPDHTYHLMGRLCTSADWLAKYRCLPKLRRGDVIAIMDAGAYFTSYSSNFAFPRPKIVMLEDGVVRTLRERETFEHLTAMDGLQPDG
ncbi:MAG: diaminopimelate decarboxylase [Gammaproteobacteria bacterium]|nr:diaminopimelate decarboxylase [Gammaproteobacteria bacterium]